MEPVKNMEGRNSRYNPAWMTFAGTVLLYTAIVSGFVFTNRANQINNKESIASNKEEIRELRQDFKNYAEKIFEIMIEEKK